MTNWYYSVEGHATGPVSEGRLGELAQEGVVNTDTLIWEPRMEVWEPVWKLRPEIIGMLNKKAMARQAKGSTDRIPAAEPPVVAPPPSAFVKQVPVAPTAPAPTGFFSRLFGRKKK